MRNRETRWLMREVRSLWSGDRKCTFLIRPFDHLWETHNLIVKHRRLRKICFHTWFECQVVSHAYQWCFDVKIIKKLELKDKDKLGFFCCSSVFSLCQDLRNWPNSQNSSTYWVKIVVRHCPTFQNTTGIKDTLESCNASRNVIYWAFKTQKNIN